MILELQCEGQSINKWPKLLKYLSEFKGNRKIAVLGDMLELGKYSQELHEKVGETVYQNKIDILMCAGKDAKYIAKKAQEMGMKEKNIYYFPCYYQLSWHPALTGSFQEKILLVLPMQQKQALLLMMTEYW